VDIANENGFTPIYAAAVGGHTEVFREFLNRGARVDIANEDSCTSLYLAALYDHVDVR